MNIGLTCDTVIFGEEPEVWEGANITSISKSNDKADPLNFTPESLTRVICRLCKVL